MEPLKRPLFSFGRPSALGQALQSTGEMQPTKPFPNSFTRSADESSFSTNGTLNGAGIIAIKPRESETIDLTGPSSSAPAKLNSPARQKTTAFNVKDEKGANGIAEARPPLRGGEANAYVSQLTASPPDLRRPAQDMPRYGTSILTLVVKPHDTLYNAPEPFTFHEQLIRSHSRTIDEMTSGFPENAQERSISIPFGCPISVSFYQQWLYTGHIFCKKSSAFPPAVEAEYLNLANAHVLGGELKDPDFQDAVVDAFISKYLTEKGFPHALLGRLFAELDSTSRLKDFLIDMVAWEGEEGWLKTAGFDEWDRNLAFDIMAALMRSRGRMMDKEDAPYRRNTCQYHRHGQTGSSCYKTKTLHCISLD